MAKGLGVSEDQVFAITRGLGAEALRSDSELTNLLNKYKSLQREDREALRVLINVIDREIDRRLH